MKFEKHIIGSILLLISIAIFSTLEIASKELRQITTEISSYCLVFFRFAATGLVLAIWGYIGFRKEKRTLSWKDWRNFFINGLVGIALSIFLFHKAIDVFAQASSAAASANCLPMVLYTDIEVCEYSTELLCIRKRPIKASSPNTPIATM